MIKKISKEVTAIHFKNFGSIVYLIQIPTKNNQTHNILIDTSSKENLQELIKSLKELKLSPRDIKTIILTHGHYDHIENINLFQNANIYGNFTKIINNNHTQTEIKKILPIEKFSIKDFKIFKLPGHTLGDIAILYKKILFSGDIIFHNGYIGRNDFPESNPKKQKKSLEKLSTINFEILCPGH